MNRFDSVPFDAMALGDSVEMKSKLQELEKLIDRYPAGRSKSIALTHLEDAHMWCNKMIRDNNAVIEGAK